MHADFLASINIALRGIALLKIKREGGKKMKIRIAEVVKELITRRQGQERVSRQMTAHDALHSLPMHPNNAYARGVSHSNPTPASTTDPHKYGDEGVRAIRLGQTDCLSAGGLLGKANTFKEHKGNGG